MYVYLLSCPGRSSKSPKFSMKLLGLLLGCQITEQTPSLHPDTIPSRAWSAWASLAHGTLQVHHSSAPLQDLGRPPKRKSSHAPSLARATFLRHTAGAPLECTSAGSGKTCESEIRERPPFARATCPRYTASAPLRCIFTASRKTCAPAPPAPAPSESCLPAPAPPLPP